MRILAVDDDLFARSMLVEALKLSGYEDVSMAVSGVDAIGQINSAEAPFDCFLLDVQMDGMDGIVLCKTIRAFPSYGEVPVIMVTAMHDKQFVNAAFKAGATDYVTKPFEMLELGTRVRIAENISLKIKKIARGEIEIAKLNGLVGASVQHHREMQPEIVAEGFVEREVFEACLQKMSVTDLQKIALMTCRIANFEQIDGRTSDADLEILLSNIATAIGDSFEGHEFITTYCGNGVFLGAFRGAPSKEQQISIQDRLNQFGMSGANGYQGLALLEFGEPVWFNQLTVEDPLELVRSELAAFVKPPTTFEIASADFGAGRQTEDPQTKLETRLRDMVPHYLSVLNEALTKLDVLSQNLSDGTGNWVEIDEISKFAHKIAGVAPTLGFSELGQSAFRTEQLISNARNSNDLDTHRAEIGIRVNELLDTIEDTIVEHFGGQMGSSQSTFVEA
jgi:CheY-like chemotaxis protein